MRGEDCGDLCGSLCCASRSGLRSVLCISVCGVFKSYCTCHLKYVCCSYMHAYMLKQLVIGFQLSLPEKTEAEKCCETNTIYPAAHSYIRLYGLWCFSVCVRWGKKLLMSCFFIHTFRHTHTHVFDANDVQDVNMSLYMFILLKTCALILRRTCKTTCVCKRLILFVALHLVVCLAFTQ